MAITEHASSPAVVKVETSAATATTAAFTPPAGSIVVAVFSCGYTDSNYSATITSSAGGAWTEAAEISGTGTYNGGVTVAYLQSPGTSMTVTATVNNGGSGKGPYVLAVKVLEGVNTSDPVGDTATSASASSTTTATASLTTAANSVVYGGAHSSDQGSTSTYSAAANTAMVDQFYSGDAGSNIDLFASAAVFKSASATTAGTRNYGVTRSSGSAGSVAMVEFLAGATAITGDVSITAPAAAYDSVGEAGSPATGTMSATAPMPTAELTADAEVSGSVGMQAPFPTAELTAAAEASGTLAAQAPFPTVDASGTNEGVTGSLAGTAPAAEANATGTATVSGTVDTEAPFPGVQADGNVSGAPGAVMMVAPAAQADASGSVSFSGDLDGTAPAAGAQAEGEATAAGTVAVEAPFPAYAGTGITEAAPATGTVDATAPGATFYGEGHATNTGTVSATAPMPQFLAEFIEPERVRKPRTIIMKPEARRLVIKR